MNLRGIVAVSGKPGLYKVIGQNKAGFVLESLDEAKKQNCYQWKRQSCCFARDYSLWPIG